MNGVLIRRLPPISKIYHVEIFGGDIFWQKQLKINALVFIAVKNMLIRTIINLTAFFIAI